MKYLYKIIAALFIVSIAASCDVNDEFYEELDKTAELVNVQEVEYTFIEKDYSFFKDEEDTDKNNISSYKSFSKYQQGADYLAEFIDSKYPYLDNGSTAQITADFYRGKASYLYNLEELEGSYTLTTEDYGSMGEPGDHNNFSSSIPTIDYIPTFLKLKYNYAKQGMVLPVIYNFYKGKIDGVHTTVIEANEFTFDGENWIQYATTIVKKDNFSKKDGEWIFVPAIKFAKVVATDDAILYDGQEDTSELTDEDYDLLGEGKYKNFSVGSGKNYETEEARIAALTKILKERIGDLEIGQVYFIEYNVYGGDDATQDTNNNGLWDMYLEAVEDN